MRYLSPVKPKVGVKIFHGRPALPTLALGLMNRGLGIKEVSNGLEDLSFRISFH
jgi:hypothetical protein